MVILVVADDFCWPPTYGGALRLAHAIEALGRVGEIDLFALTYPLRQDGLELPEGLPVRRWTTVTNSAPDYSIARRVRWLTSRLPLELVAATDISLAAEFSAWVDGRYDLVFFSRPEVFVRTGSPRLGPTIIDYVDLEDHKIASRLAAEKAQGVAVTRSPLRRLAGNAQARLNISRWKRLEQSAGRAADRVTCCSDQDCARLELITAVVIPNCYDAPERPLGRDDVGDPPTILLQGSLRYAPNTDAARRLVYEVLPLVKAEVPNVQVRLVGEEDPGVARLHDPPTVSVVGRVPAMGPELARADLVAAPVRYGSGTRVKILEAMAHRIPVVSTRIGAEGLGLEHGRDALLCDDMDEFAAACTSLLRDVDLRRKLVGAAQSRFLENFQWTDAQDRLEDLAIQTATGAAHNPRSKGLPKG